MGSLESHTFRYALRNVLSRFSDRPLGLSAYSRFFINTWSANPWFSRHSTLLSSSITPKKSYHNDTTSSMAPTFVCRRCGISGFTIETDRFRYFLIKPVFESILVTESSFWERGFQPKPTNRLKDVSTPPGSLYKIKTSSLHFFLRRRLVLGFRIKSGFSASCETNIDFL